eukprot:CAMPEP_0170427592 /NCGR_PEP_ID=MMETSP0117_2-20130122/39311_1 /TAXON_ID=400756 /ORGANISM="Durinskia baltica, Strain CSIRO CS-38" /LENGTH=121 /DNA_ID=CAMNT_0010686813 /DNA_START=62 /DNA_END=427 /DNA_ORIENTATION=+
MAAPTIIARRVPACFSVRGSFARSAVLASSRNCGTAVAAIHDVDIVGCRDLLGLKDGDGEVEARRAYRALARRCHPDRGGRREDFQQLQCCYEIVLQELRGPRKSEWLEQMKKDFANFSCC